MGTLLNPKRTVAELKELRALTADDNGAQRVAFTPMWVKTRAWLKKKRFPPKTTREPRALPAQLHCSG